MICNIPKKAVIIDRKVRLQCETADTGYGKMKGQTADIKVLASPCLTSNNESYNPPFNPNKEINRNINPNTLANI